MIFRSPYPDVSIPEIAYPELILAHAEERGDDRVLVDGSTGRVVTARQVVVGARRAASWLARKGFRKGDIVAIVSPNVPEYAIAFHAAALLGGVVTTANPLYTAGELAHQLRDTGAKYVVTIPPLLDKTRAAAKGGTVRETFVFGEAEGATPFATLLEGDGDVPRVTIDPRSDLVALPYSSGTSGRPKGVMLTHYNLVAITRQVESFVQSEAWRTAGILPFFHIYGLVVLMNYPIYARGGLCVTLPRFDLAEFLRIVQDYRLTHLYVVPPIVLALAKHPLVDQYDLSSVKLINSGAAPLDGRLQQACAERLHCLVTQGYGMTETSLACHVTPDDPGRVKQGASGLTLPNMASKVIDTVSGAELGVGERGEICVRGPNVMRGYLHDAEATARTLDAEGWLHTGDVGYADADGYFYVVDRVKELIKYKGMQVAPAELEAVLLSHPDVADAAVIPSPDEEAGEVPKAFLVLRGAGSTDAILGYVAERVAPHKKIRRVEVVDAIPKSPSGKILRRVLIEQERAQRR